MKDLVEAGAYWRSARGPRRSVVDQIVLVDDVPSFFSALEVWNQTTFFPILLDDPIWTPAFVRAFHPSRIVRFKASAESTRSGPMDEWRVAERAVGRSWMGAEDESADPPPAGSLPRDLGPTPPGVVLSHPGSASLCGAAALAAGRFQPLLRLDPLTIEAAPGKPSKTLGFDDVPTLAQALDFARRVDSRVASIAPQSGKLGDQVDFLTLAGDWPYRYRAADGSSGEDDRALDDLLGRNLPGGSVDPDSLRLRWAYAGRLLGDAPASVYRAMASLFLQPRSSLLWNTYSGGPPWSEYDVTGATSILQLVRPDPDAVLARSGNAADLNAWHEATAAPNARGLILMNSSGAPRDFSIPGGPGLAGDVPFGPPSVISLIHSFSAAYPNDPTTIAGRFLERGAYSYFGSMNEPFLTAFRSPYLVTQMMSVEMPLSAALRQGPYEAYGQPWKLVYLGDPLYRLETWSDKDAPQRVAPSEPPAGASPLAMSDRPDPRDQRATLDWCYEVALVSMTLPVSEIQPASRTREILDLLTIMDPERLDPQRRVKYDALLIDQFVATGDYEGLLKQLLQSPARSRSPFVWRAIESAVLHRISDSIRKEDFSRALDLWYPIVVGPWPPGSDFPDRLTRRLASAAQAGGPDRAEPFRRLLTSARDQLDASKNTSSHRAILEEELKKLGKSSSPR
ncbi:hypothetical protein [Paludisphaera rhizosphaerae]|uniref:hypothetical protein n=1 Tax=Paludisphaera rhizosphaerae TaxID=2711216 RepID=UPI0013EC9964|nr:hypothetical protein [Paludisphaera rhizosphaerae]